MFAGDCLVSRSDKCAEVGVGPEAFDCSGLVIGAISTVMGKRPGNWPVANRHVREMWFTSSLGREDEYSGDGSYPSNLSGSLVVMSRKYSYHDDPIIVPGHIGIVSGYEDGRMRYIHASPNKGIVEETTISRMESVLGLLRFDPDSAEHSGQVFARTPLPSQSPTS
jgi:hypothetical protein